MDIIERKLMEARAHVIAAYDAPTSLRKAAAMVAAVHALSAAIGRPISQSSNELAKSDGGMCAEVARLQAGIDNVDAVEVPRANRGLAQHPFLLRK